MKALSKKEIIIFFVILNLIAAPFAAYLVYDGIGLSGLLLTSIGYILGYLVINMYLFLTYVVLRSLPC